MNNHKVNITTPASYVISLYYNKLTLYRKVTVIRIKNNAQICKISNQHKFAVYTPVEKENHEVYASV